MLYIAIVEDDESVARSMARLLLSRGYQPVIYHTAEAFLDDTKKPVYDCLILDIQLDGMFGIDLERHLNQNGPTAPVIFLTALDDFETLKFKTASPGAVFLRKSDPADCIFAEIEKAIGREAADSRGQCQ